MSRPERVFEIEGRAWRAIEAWRAESGHALCYLLPMEAGAPLADDGDDRRASLEPGESVTALDEAAMLERFRSAVPLTETEARFEDEQGRSWLVQSVGPVWEGSGVAERLTGLRFTSLSGPLERLVGPGGHVAGLPRERLVALLGELRGTA